MLQQAALYDLEEMKHTDQDRAITRARYQPTGRFMSGKQHPTNNADLTINTNNTNVQTNPNQRTDPQISASGTLQTGQSNGGHHQVAHVRSAQQVSAPSRAGHQRAASADPAITFTEGKENSSNSCSRNISKPSLCPGQQNIKRENALADCSPVLQQNKAQFVKPQNPAIPKLAAIMDQNR